MFKWMPKAVSMTPRVERELKEKIGKVKGWFHEKEVRMIELEEESSCL